MLKNKNWNSIINFRGIEVHTFLNRIQKYFALYNFDFIIIKL